MNFVLEFPKGFLSTVAPAIKAKLQRDFRAEGGKVLFRSNQRSIPRIGMRTQAGADED